MYRGFHGEKWIENKEYSQRTKAVLVICKAAIFRNGNAGGNLAYMGREQESMAPLRIDCILHSVQVWIHAWMYVYVCMRVRLSSNVRYVIQ